MGKKICGIDEAGRGPVIGSMFIAGVLVDEKDMEKLDTMGFKDSKKLSDSKRRELGKKVEDFCEKIVVEEFTASEIDELRKIMSLNVIELRGFSRVIKKLEADRAIVDLPEPDGERFGRKIIEELPDNFKDLEIVAEHSADENYPIVSAASIVAKNARENHVEELKKKYGRDFRSGYPHDKPTINFLEDYYSKNGEMPEETRMSWSTAKKIVQQKKQSSIGDF